MSFHATYWQNLSLYMQKCFRPQTPWLSHSPPQSSTQTPPICYYRGGGVSCDATATPPPFASNSQRGQLNQKMWITRVLCGTHCKLDDAIDRIANGASEINERLRTRKSRISDFAHSACGTRLYIRPKKQTLLEQHTRRLCVKWLL